MTIYLWLTAVLFVLAALGNVIQATSDDRKLSTPRQLAVGAVINTLLAAWAVGLLVTAGGG